MITETQLVRSNPVASGSSKMVSVIVPTRNEPENVQRLAERLATSLGEAGLSGELIFVDDSDDDTCDRIAGMKSDILPVVLIHRSIGEREGGLAGAVVEGFRVAGGDVLVVMDGDLQHPPEVVPLLVQSLLDRENAVAVGSRYLTNTRSEGLSGPVRRIISQSSRLLVRILFPSIRNVRDPLSGLFALEHTVIDGVSLTPKGFKILLEILVRGEWREMVEVSYAFAGRERGASKADWSQGIQFLRHLIALRLVGRERCGNSESKPNACRPRPATLMAVGVDD